LKKAIQNLLLNLDTMVKKEDKKGGKVPEGRCIRREKSKIRNCLLRINIILRLQKKVYRTG